jgi:DNA polymerase III alpha subunit
MNISKYGQVSLSEQEAFDALYSGKIQNFENLFFTQDLVEQFNSALDTNKDNISKLSSIFEPDEDISFFDEANQSEWFMPENYCPDLVEHLYSLCKTDREKDRVTKELELFINHNMFDLLFYLKYLVDTMRENNIVWGVGRGSSVASYVLFLIGIHKIDSLKYELDISEFLK